MATRHGGNTAYLEVRKITFGQAKTPPPPHIYWWSPYCCRHSFPQVGKMCEGVAQGLCSTISHRSDHGNTVDHQNFRSDPSSISDVVHIGSVLCY